MKIIDIINVIAIIVSPLVAVLVGQYLQNKEKKRADKMDIFKTLMIWRGMGWTLDSVKALNTIEVVFGDDKKVINQWKNYYNSLCIENPSETELLLIKNEGNKLLAVMAKSLGYKKTVTWETIQKPYIPKGLTDNMNQQQQYQNVQMNAIKAVNEYVVQMNKENVIASSRVPMDNTIEGTNNKKG